MLLNIKHIVAKNKIAFAILLIAIFLRFFRFEEFVTFLGDQGRDAIVIKRLLTFEDLPFLGPISSVGGVFLGPFFYYIMSPFLLLFNFNPVGLAFASAFYTIIGLVAAYFVIKKEVDKSIGVLTVFFISFSMVQIEFARSSWNPYLLPVFSFFSIYFLYRLIKTRDILSAVLFGSFISFSIQLHYLYLLLTVPFGLVILYELVTVKNRLSFIKLIIISFVSFVFFFSPLILFDIKNNFLNARNFIKFFNSPTLVSDSSYWFRLLDTNKSFYSHIFKLDLNQYLALSITALITLYFALVGFLKKNLFLKLHFLSFLTFIGIFSYLSSFRFPHYFTPVYFSFFLIFSYVLLDASRKWKFLYFSVLAIIIVFLFGNIRDYYFFKNRGSNQIGRARNLAISIIKHNPKTPYQIVPEPFTETDGHIRYFLELMGKPPLSESANEQAEELYILCYKKDCSEVAHPQWQIASFKNARVATIWSVDTVDKVKIYKVVHGR